MPPNEPEIIGDIRNIEVIAVGNAIRELADLKADYGGQRWRKLKGIATIVKYDNGIARGVLAEVHWYECHGVGRRRMKVKRELE